MNLFISKTEEIIMNKLNKKINPKCLDEKELN